MDAKKVLVAAEVLGKILFTELKTTNEDSSSDEDIEIKRKVRPRIPPTRIKSYLETIIPHYTSNQFQMHFRVSPRAFDALLAATASFLIKTKEGPGRPYSDPKKQLLSVLWLLATPDSYRSVSDRFSIGKASLWDSFSRVVIALNKIASKIIIWPESIEKMTKISKNFKTMSRAGLSNVVGCVDGCHIAIKAPHEHHEVYITRKCEYAVTLQAICDSSLKFIDCYCGYPGSVGDRRIFKNSDIYKKIVSNTEKYLPQEFYIVGDKAYPVLDWCIPPYIDRGNLTDREEVSLC